MPSDSTSDVPVATVEKREKKTPTTVPPSPEIKTNPDGGFSIEAPDLRRLVKHQNLTAYWCGATADSIIQNIYVKGICFPRWTNIPQVHDKRDENDQAQFLGSAKPTLGTYNDLTDRDLADFIEVLPFRVLRKLGSRSAVILDIRRENYRADVKRDRPLGEVIYMVPKHSMDASARDNIPAPLITPKE